MNNGNNEYELFRGWALLHRLREEKPLIHCITNYVTANDVANMILASGASPVMADDKNEVEEITALSKALVLNLGTLKESSIDSMLLAGKKAVSLGNPVILDPVGAGASVFRTKAAQKILKEIPCTVIRGNASEIRAAAGAISYSQGVDADIKDQVTDSNLADTESFLKDFSNKTGAVIIMTGETDMIADKDQVCKVRNGHSMMAGITGTGCMLDGILAAFQAASMQVNPLHTTPLPTAPLHTAPSHTTPLPTIHHTAPDSTFLRCIYAVAAAGICGELAYEKTASTEAGTASFRIHYIDAMSKLTDKDIQGGIRFEI